MTWSKPAYTDLRIGLRSHHVLRQSLISASGQKRSATPRPVRGVFIFSSPSFF